MKRKEITAWQGRVLGATKMKDLGIVSRLDLQRDLALWEIATQLAIANELARDQNRLLRRGVRKKRG